MFEATAHHRRCHGRGSAGRWLALLLLVPMLSARAQPRERGIAQFYHSRWTVKDGAPGQVSVLAQTRDGFLWMATGASLYTFDGVRFERFVAPDGLPLGSVSALLATPEGGLWMSFTHGGAAYLHEGTLKRYGEAEGLLKASLMSLALDGEGRVWAAGPFSGLNVFEGGRWTRWGPDQGIEGNRVYCVLVDRDGGTWAVAGEALVYREPGARAFRPVTQGMKWVSRMAQAPDGAIWVAEPQGHVRRVGLPGGRPHPLPARLEVESAGLLFDREGSLWVTSLGDGLRRVAWHEQLGAEPLAKDAAPVELFTERDGLSADYTWPILEDREGTLWVGTSAGVDRLRRSALVPAPFPRGAHDFALAVGGDGAVWAGTTNRPLMRLSGRVVENLELGAAVRSAYRDAEGTVWLAAENGLWRIERGRPVLVTAYPFPGDAVQVQRLVRDAEGGVWVIFVREGLWRWKDGTWRPKGDELQLTRQPRLTVMATDARGQVWLGHDAAVLRVDGARVRRWDAADGLDVGVATSLLPGRRVWLGGLHGLAYLDGERFRTFQVELAGESLRGVSGIQEMPDGSLWLHAVPGVLHVPAEEVARVLAEPGRRARAELFDFLDGLQGRPALVRPLPTMVRGPDGRLWFATSNGVVWVDPARIERNPLPPPVSIRRMRVDGATLPLGEDLVLPQGAGNLEIDYTALSLSIPERVRFRYRLEGVDEDWQDVGTRRTAYYSRLEPGRYRFRVIAANHDGVWNETGATLGFYLPPTSFQTWWFRVLCWLAALAAGWGLYRLRVRQVQAQTRRLLEERHRERVRIARELHDTLLQGVHGLVLRFQTAAEQIPADHPARVSMEKALDRADEVLVEGRDRVMDLRAATEQSEDLAAALARVGRSLMEEHGVEFRLVEEGSAVPLDAMVHDEAFHIGREALMNAFQHARARRIEAELTYDFGMLRLRVRDDGRGVDEAFLRAGGKPGHWGLSGMRERALRIGARMEIWCREGAGTEVELRVPAGRAYRGASQGAWRAWLRRLVSGVR
ncbi:histidine kinase [Myxococcus stipitatus]|uniref:sensor histidine kinase n=1 Tax=Myxococcus stipitatus TaxID=83455 RepID=UPI001F1AE4BB|nr:triple tyrosine motif-containing protein [Myxococcus stipitatus]MCE9672876.1 histidine kinase [Myxococcus stipitatus]